MFLQVRYWYRSKKEKNNEWMLNVYSKIGTTIAISTVPSHSTSFSWARKHDF